MADGHLNFDTKISTSGFSKGIKSISGLLGGIKSSLAGITSALGAAFNVSAVVSYAKAAKEAYNVQLEGETKLETIMKQRMNATDDMTESIKEFTAQQQELGIVGDEVQNAGAQQVATFLKEADSIKTLIPAMNDLLAQQKGLNASTGDAVTVANLMGKVLQGQTSALNRVGISFTEAEEKVLKYGTESERAAMLAQVITNNVGHMNEALANTSAGRIKQVENTMADIKEQFGAAVTQIEVLLLPALKKTAQLLKTVADGAMQVADALSKAFGGKGVQTAAASLAGSTDSLDSGAQDAAESYGDMAKAAEKADKANRKSLASFDELNVASGTNESESENTEISSPAQASETQELSQPLTLDLDTKPAEDALTEMIERIKEDLLDIFKPIQTAWDNTSPGLISSVASTMREISGLFSDVGRDFRSVWSNGTGEKVMTNIFNTIKNINTFTGNLTENFRAAWNEEDRGLEIAQSIGDILETSTGWADTLTASWTEWASTVDFAPLLDAISGFLPNIKDLIDIIGGAFQTVSENILQPLASWFIESGIPAAINLISAAFGVFNDILSIVIDTLTIIGGAVAAFWEGLFGEDSSPLDLITGRFELLTSVLGWLDEKLGGVSEALSEFIGMIDWEAVTKWWTDFFDGIKKSINDIGEKIIGFWNTLKDGAKNAWESIKNVFGAVAEFFGGIFSKAWEKVQKVFSKGGEIFKGIKEGIFSAFKKVVNALIDGINTVVAVPFNAINSALATIRDIEIVGYSPFDWITLIDVPQIPHLANGMVVPANYGEFGAILGDNRREPEVVSPYSTILAAVEEGLRRHSSQDDGDIIVQIDGHEVFRALRREADHYYRQHGRYAFGG